MTVEQTKSRSWHTTREIHTEETMTEINCETFSDRWKLFTFYWKVAWRILFTGTETITVKSTTYNKATDSLPPVMRSVSE
jgi:hypothetical protein